jgi:hypothetical protein
MYAGQEASIHGQTAFDRPSLSPDCGGFWGAFATGGRQPLWRLGGKCSRWVFAANSGGPIAAKPQGGDTRSHHIEAFREAILDAIAARKDITLVELSEFLRTRHDVSFAPSTVWRFLDRHAMTFKKNCACQRAGTARRRRASTSLVRRPA